MIIFAYSFAAATIGLGVGMVVFGLRELLSTSPLLRTILTAYFAAAIGISTAVIALITAYLLSALMVNTFGVGMSATLLIPRFDIGFQDWLFWLAVFLANALLMFYRIWLCRNASVHDQRSAKYFK
jgi:hypothetical protein